MKKFLSLCLVCVFLFSSVVPTFAGNGFSGNEHPCVVLTQEGSSGSNAPEGEAPGQENPQENTKYFYIDINGERTEIEVGGDIPANTPSVTTSNNNDTHTVTAYTWVQSETESNTFNEVGITETVNCNFEVTQRIAPTCVTPGKETMYTCSVCAYVKGGTEIAPSPEYHSYRYAITKNPTCTEDGAVIATCEFCHDTYTYVVNSAHQYRAYVVTKAATCTEKGEETAVCKICNHTITRELDATGHTVREDFVRENDVPATCTQKATYDKVYYCQHCDHEFERETVIDETSELLVHTVKGEFERENYIPATCTHKATYDEVYYCQHCDYEFTELRRTVEAGEALGHNWSTEDVACNRCDTKDTIKSVKIKSCSVNDYFVKDAYKSNISLEIQCDNHTFTVQISDNCLVTEDGKVFKTTNVGTYKCYAKYSGVRSSNTVTINVTKPKLNMTCGGSTVFDGNIYSTDERGLVFKAVSTSGDKIKYTVGDNLKVSYNSDKKEYTVKPTKYFDVYTGKQSDYFVKFYFVRNGVEYSKTVFIKCMISTLECTTKEAVFEYKKGAKTTKTIYLTATYMDGKTKKIKKTIDVDLSKVGKYTKTYTYYGETVTYTYYVKCDKPTLKATAKSKAVKLSWNKVIGASGYKIYRSTSKSGTYKLVKTISSGSTTSYTNTKLSSKKTYYYKIVATNSKTSKCNSSSSTIVSCKTK